MLHRIRHLLGRLHRELSPLEIPQESIEQLSWLEGKHAELGVPGSGDGDESYLRFEDIFYDPETVIPLQSGYLRFLPKGTDRVRPRVVDVGCGRGEFLSLLNDAGYDAIGVERNAVEAQRLRDRGFEVAEGDAMAVLGGLADGSADAITAFEVIEHMSPQYFSAFIRLAVAKLRVGGCLILETPNYLCDAVKYAFWLDLTHVRPYPVETVAFQCLEAGLEHVSVRYSLPRPPRNWVWAADSSIYANYALIGYKGGAEGMEAGIPAAGV